jgi:hypothetical protein
VHTSITADPGTSTTSPAAIIGVVNTDAKSVVLRFNEKTNDWTLATLLALLAIEIV